MTAKLVCQTCGKSIRECWCFAETQPVNRRHVVQAAYQAGIKAAETRFCGMNETELANTEVDALVAGEGQGVETTVAYWKNRCEMLEQDAAEPVKTSPRMSAKSDWVNCPICGQPDMNKETDADGNSLISCTNLACWSNGGTYSQCDCAEAVKELRKYLNQNEGETVLGGIRNLAQALVSREDEIEQLNIELTKARAASSPVNSEGPVK